MGGWIPPRQLYSAANPRGCLTTTTSAHFSGLTQTIFPQRSSHHALHRLGWFTMSIYDHKWAKEHLENPCESSGFHTYSCHHHIRTALLLPDEESLISAQADLFSHLLVSLYKKPKRVLYPTHHTWIIYWEHNEIEVSLIQ